MVWGGESAESLLGKSALFSHGNFSQHPLHGPSRPQEELHFLLESFLLSRHSVLGAGGEKKLAIHGESRTRQYSPLQYFFQNG